MLNIRALKITESSLESLTEADIHNLLQRKKQNVCEWCENRVGGSVLTFSLFLEETWTLHSDQG